MKNLKKFKDLKDYIFAINVEDSTLYEKREIISQLENYFEVYIDEDQKREMTNLNRYNKILYWVITIREIPKIHIYFASTPGWGAGEDFIEDAITAKEFLEIGAYKVENFILAKKEIRLLNKDIDKYNL